MKKQFNIRFLRFLRVLPILIILTVGIVIYKYKFGGADKASPKRQAAAIEILKSELFEINKDIKKIAFLGSTPHPTKFLKESLGATEGTCPAGTPHSDIFSQLKNIKLEQFLDLQDLDDSFEQVIKLCLANNIDQLVIAYLPIHFVEIKKLLQENYIEAISNFLDSISLQVLEIIQTLVKKLNYRGNIILALPTAKALNKIPGLDSEKLDFNERIRYLVKQFPKIGNINQSNLEEIVIINNQRSDQNQHIINYLKYRYLFDKKVNYKVLNICKDKFHKFL